MLTSVKLLFALMSLLVQQVLGEDENKVTISRHYQGDMFFGHGSTCEDGYCERGGMRSAKTVRRGSCQCQCSRSTPVFRDDLQTCVDDVEECILADYVSGSSTEKVPFVFLPLKGQLIHPEAEIALADMRSEGQALLSPVCVVSKAHFLTPKGWVPIENGSSTEPPFSLYREDTKTYLQWLGDGALRLSLDGRLVLVRLLCKDTANARIGVFSPCIGFRIAGSPGAAEITFDGGSLDVTPVAGSVLQQGNYVAIGIASGVLGLLYVLGVVGFLVYRRRRKAAANRKAKLDSISSPILEDGKIKANPLLLQSPVVGGLKRSDSKSGQKSLVDHHEAMAMFQDAARRHVSPSGLHSPDFSHMSYPFTAGLLPGQVPALEDDLLDAQLFQAGFDPALLTKEDRDVILGQSYLDQSSFESQSPEFLARVRSAIDSARLKMSSRKFFPSLFDIPEEQRDYGSVSKESQISRRSSFKAMLQPKSEPKPAQLQPSSDSGANGDTSDSSQTKSTTDGSNQPIYVSRRKKQTVEKTYGTIKKNVTSTLEKVKQTFSKEESRTGEVKQEESQTPPKPVYTNPCIESIYGSLMKESRRSDPPEEKEEFANGRTTFSEVNKQPLYDRLKISEKETEESVMKPAERVYEVCTSSVQTETSPVKPVMVEKATYTTMTIIRANSKASEKKSKVSERAQKNAGTVDDILSDAESKIPKMSSDSEPETAVKHFQKKICFEPDSLDRPRRAFETPQKSFVKNSKAKSDRYEMRKIQKAKVEAAKKPESPEMPECDSLASTCKSVKSLSRVLPGGEELEIGNGLYNMATGASTLKKSAKKEEKANAKGDTLKKPMSKTNSGELSDVSTTSKREIWDLAGDSNWFAKPSEKAYQLDQEEEYSSLESSPRKPVARPQTRKPAKIEDSKSEYSCSDDNGFEPDTLEKHRGPSRRQRFIDSLERPSVPTGTLKQRTSQKPPARNPPRYETGKNSPRKLSVGQIDREAPRIPAKKTIISSLEKAHSKSLPSFERMVDESPALPMKSLRQIFESEDSINQSPAPPRPSKGIDIQRLNEEIGKQSDVRNPAEQRRGSADPPPKLPPRTGGILPPNLPPKSVYRRSTSLDELMDYEPIGSVHSGISAYDDAKSTTSSVHDLLMRIEEFEREEAMLRQSHIMDEEGRITESGISKGMEIALQIRAKMLENRNTKSSIKIKLRKFLEKMEDTFSENDGATLKKAGKNKNFSRTDTIKSVVSQISLASTVESSGDYDSHKRALAEQSSIHSDTDWHFSAHSTPQNGRRSSDTSDRASLGSDGTGNESSCSFDTLKTRKSYPMKPAGDYGFFVNNIYSSDTAKKKTMSSVDSGVFSTGQFDGRVSASK